MLCFMISIMLIAKAFYDNNKIKEIGSSMMPFVLNQQLDDSFCFITISDSKFIGLFIFLTSNLLTGLVNLSINTLHVSNYISFSILSIYSFFSFFIPFIVYKYLFIKSVK
jgi:hypothetical protein